ncbi:MAG: class I SAM-dependent methyltransferase [Actinomycetota bacterium]
MADSNPARIVASRYSEQAVAYRRHWAPLLVEFGKELLGKLPLADARRVVDLGTGVGALLPEIRARAPDALVVGADIAEGMIQLAQPTFSRVMANAAALPFRDRTFDVVTMAFMLFHVPDPASAVGEVHRILRPGGMVGVATWGPDVDDSPAQRMWLELLEEFGAPDETDIVARHELTDSLPKVARLLEEGGFTMVAQLDRTSVDAPDLAEFFARRTSLGREHRRLRSLDPSAQEAFLAAAQERLAALGPADFTSRDHALLTWAERPRHD